MPIVELLVLVVVVSVDVDVEELGAQAAKVAATRSVNSPVDNSL